MLLFAIKLYVGLSSNSISIYSDGINNLFDSLAGIISFVFLSLALRSKDVFSSHRAEKTEQLLNFIICIILSFSGFYFAYNSLERLFYPTPVWYRTTYLYLLCLTLGMKLILFVFLKASAKKLDSDILKAISADSITDFFITLFTVMTLVLSSRVNFAVDAYCGFAISLIIIVQAFRMIASAVRKLLGLPDEEEREALTELLAGLEVKKIKFICSDDEKIALVHLGEGAAEEAMLEKIKNQTDITVAFIR